MADFSLKAVFGMDATGVKTELKSLRKDMNSFISDYAKLGAGMAVAAFTALSKGAIDLAGRLSDTSQNIGINVVSLQALEAQHKRNGVSNETLTAALQKTKATVLDASAGNEKANASLRALGLSVEKLIKLPLDQQYETIAKAAAKSKNESQAYAAVCDILGDKVGPKLMGSLKELGTVGLPAVTKSAREAGQVMEKETIVALDRAGDAIDDFKKRATVAVGNILVNFRSAEGLQLLGMQIAKVVVTFGAGILDAIVEGGQMIGAVFSGAFRGVLNYLQDGMVESAKFIANMMNKVLPERYEIKIGNLDQFKSSGKGIADEITEAIARTEPSNFKKTISDGFDAAIGEQKKIVDAMNAVDFGKDAKKLEDAGTKVSKAIKEAIPEKIEVVPSPELKSVFDGIKGVIGRKGAAYEQQSDAALEGVAARIKKQLSDYEIASFGTPGGVGGKATPIEIYGLRNELAQVERELALRRSVEDYASRFGEDAARRQFGDSATTRALADLTKDSTRTAGAVESTNERLRKLLGG